MKPKISTGTGDAGETGLIGNIRIKKSDTRMHAIGSLDELNCLLGVIISGCHHLIDFSEDLNKIQGILFKIGASLADESGKNIERFPKNSIQEIEERLSTLENKLSELNEFILPGGSHTGALTHQARSVCRRAERWIVDLHQINPLDENILKYVNRLSDYLFLAARIINEEVGKQESTWKE